MRAGDAWRPFAGSVDAGCDGRRAGAGAGPRMVDWDEPGIGHCCAVGCARLGVARPIIVVGRLGTATCGCGGVARGVSSGSEPLNGV